MAIKMRPDVQRALHEYNMSTTGRALDPRGIVDDPEVIARLERMAMPGEDLNDTILRLLRGNVSTAVN
jgi:hypothetical protein